MGLHTEACFLATIIVSFEIYEICLDALQNHEQLYI